MNIRNIVMSMLGAGLMTLFAGCGGGGGGPGGPNDPCGRRGFDGNACEAGLVCGVGRTCRPCGDPGQPCCPLNTCTDGSIQCVENDGVRTCGDCGEVGEACCMTNGAPYCSSGVRCNTDTMTCEAPMTDPCTGSTRRAYYGRSDNGCSLGTINAVVTVDDEGMAERCAEAILGVPEVRQEAPTLYDTCERPRFGFCEEQQRWAFDEDDAESCAESLCGADCDILLGECPEAGICE